jgi:hypothetical protein
MSRTDRARRPWCYLTSADRRTADIMHPAKPNPFIVWEVRFRRTDQRVEFVWVAAIDLVMYCAHPVEMWKAVPAHQRAIFIGNERWSPGRQLPAPRYPHRLQAPRQPRGASRHCRPTASKCPGMIRPVRGSIRHRASRVPGTSAEGRPVSSRSGGHELVDLSHRLTLRSGLGTWIRSGSTYSAVGE